MWPRIVNIAVGVWLMATPAVLGYSGVSDAAATNDRIVGPLIVSAAIAAIWPEIRPVRWLNVVLGAWLLVGVPGLALLVDWPVEAIVSSVLAGAVVVTMARIEGGIDSRFGGGWRSLWRDDVDTISGRDPR